MARLGFITLFLYVLSSLTRVFELLMPHGRVPRILLLVALLCLVLTGRIFATMVPKVGRLWYAYMFWSLLGAPFSVWPVGALRQTVINVGRSFAVFLGLVGFVDSWKRIRLVVSAAALSFAWISLYLVFQGQEMSEGSRITSRLTSTDPNEMALQMLFSIPLWLFLLADRTSNLFLRLAAAPCVVVALGVMAKSGSRAMVLAGGMICLYLLLRLSWTRKLQATALIAVAVAGFLVAAPQESLVRYKTLLGSTVPRELPSSALGGSNLRGIAGSAQQSTESRIYLLKRSIEVTMLHPIFGVGTGMFAVAEGVISREESGQRGVWKGTHNAYTEVSSQLGIPALVIFLMIQINCWRKLTAMENVELDFPLAPTFRRFAFTMKVCYVNLLTFAATLGISENPYFFLITGLVIAAENALANERHAYERARKSKLAGKSSAAARPRPAAPAPARRPEPVGASG